MANAETNALVGLRKLLPKELFYNTDMDMLGAECEEIRIRAGRNVRFVLRGGEIAGSAVATPKLCRDVLEGLSEHSAPAIENELKEGFFTARGGAAWACAAKCIPKTAFVKGFGKSRDSI